MKRSLLIPILLLSFTSLTQQRDSLVKRTTTDTLYFTVEFSKDNYLVDENQEKRLIEFLEVIPSLRIERIQIVAHTDSDGTDDYNQRLSEKRAKSVQAIVEGEKGDLPTIEMNFQGEKQLLKQELSITDQQRNRRVELAVFHTVEYDTWVPCGGTYNCRDTLITLPSGVIYSINRCIYKSKPDCVLIQEFLSQQQLQAANLLTMDQQGNTLYSGGMLKYTICDTVKIRVYIPINESCFLEGMKRYEQTEAGWELAKEPDVNIEIINGTRYYAMPLSGVGMVNLDQIGFPTVPPKIKFKSKRGVKLEQIVLSCDCPMASVAGVAKNKRKRKIVLPRICCSDPQVRIIFTNKKGELVTVPYQSLSKLKRIRSIGGCKGEEKWKFLMFKKREKLIYKKYRVRG